MEKRLLKDLPFDSLKAGQVLIKRNNGYEMPTIPQFYETGGESSGVTYCYTSGSEKDIIDTIWDSSEWFEEATFSHVDIIVGFNETKLRYKSLSAEKAIYLAKGIQHILKHLDDESYVWNGMGGVTTRIKNN